MQREMERICYFYHGHYNDTVSVRLITASAAVVEKNENMSTWVRVYFCIFVYMNITIHAHTYVIPCHTTPYHTICADADARRIAMHSAYLFVYHFFHSLSSRSLPHCPHIVVLFISWIYISYIVFLFASIACECDVYAICHIEFREADWIR